MATVGVKGLPLCVCMMFGGLPGAIVVARALDYETVKEYMITVEARDGGTPSLSSSAVVKLVVVDANDNRPVFVHSNYMAVVREDVAVNTSLLQVHLNSCCTFIV